MMDKERIDRWVGHFYEQFTWSQTNESLGWPHPRTFGKCFLTPQEKRGKAAGPDDLALVIFKLAGEALLKTFSCMLCYFGWRACSVIAGWVTGCIGLQEVRRQWCINHCAINLTLIVTEISSLSPCDNCSHSTCLISSISRLHQPNILLFGSYPKLHTHNIVLQS